MNKKLKAHCHLGISYGHTKVISLSCLRLFNVKVQRTLAWLSVTAKTGLIEKKLNTYVSTLRVDL